MSRTNELHDILASKFRLRELRVPIGERTVALTTAEDIEDLIERITSKQFMLDERLPYWAELWHSAVALGKFLHERPLLLAGKEVLDIGCGLGLEGIAAARYCKSITFADYDENALLAAEYNALLNGAAEAAEFSLLDFREKPQRTWPLIIAADIIYENRFIAPLLEFLHFAMPDDGMFIVAEPNRLVAEEFFASLERMGYVQWYQQVEADLHGRIVAVSIHCIAKHESVLDRCMGQKAHTQ